MIELANRGVVRGRWRWQAWEDMDAFKRWLAGELVAPLAIGKMDNGITDAGIHYVEEVAFRSDAGSPVAQSAPWYAGLIDNDSFTGVAAGDTSASHSGWIESEEYSEGVRQTLAFGAAASRTVSASVAFTMNGTTSIRGIFVIDDDTKGGTTGILFSTALFGTPPSLTSGNVLTANYSLSD